MPLLLLFYFPGFTERSASPAFGITQPRRQTSGSWRTWLAAAVAAAAVAAAAVAAAAVAAADQPPLSPPGQEEPTKQKVTGETLVLTAWNNTAHPKCNFLHSLFKMCLNACTSR